MRLRKRGRSWLEIRAEPTATAARAAGAPLPEGQGDRQHDVDICSLTPLPRSFITSGGFPIPTSSSAEVAAAPDTFTPWTWGRGWLSPDPTCLLGRDHGQGLLPGRRNQSQRGASSNISLTPSTQGGQRERGHTHRRGLETCELNLVNSPGAVHSVPSW